MTIRNDVTVTKTHTGWAKKMAQFVLNTLTLSNINRFSKFFHCQNQDKICNNIITKDPTTPQVCRYTTLWNISVLRAATENKTTSVTTHFKTVTTHETTCLLSQLLSTVTVTSCSLYIKCSMCPPCCWTTQSSRRRHWPIARSMKRCYSLPHSMMIACFRWLIVVNRRRW